MKFSRKINGQTALGQPPENFRTETLAEETAQDGLARSLEGLAEDHDGRDGKNQRQDSRDRIQEGAVERGDQ